jgi:DNA-directed RNA polymerase specialized sigma24 family protein
MRQDERFDSFYRSTRRGLLSQTFALTGDLPAASGAVRDAYIAAAHHWRKVSALADPEAWVRPRAWNFAQRRHSTRIWHRNKAISQRHRLVLDALAKLPPGQRRILLLTQLAAVPLSDAARELGITRTAAERNLETATASFALALDVDPSGVRGPLEALDEAIDGAVLPRASIVRRAGRKRRQTHTLLGVIAAVAVAVGSGAIAYQPHEQGAKDLHLVKPRPQPADAGTVGSNRPTADQMLDSDQISRLGPSSKWRIDQTSNNTSGDGINTICQQTRFADPDGLSAIVRTFTATKAPLRTAVQTVEISRSVDQAKKAFHTTVGWFAGCQVARLQLLNAYRVDGIGDEATVMMVRVWRTPVKTYSVAVSRIGEVTTTTVGMTVGGRSPPPTQITQSLADSVAMLCTRSGSSTCAHQPTFTPTQPPPSGEERGILAVADLPPVGTIDEPWVGTTPAPARTNPAETTCDHADFASNGATSTRTRTFLIPQAVLPARFGLSETYGVFVSPKAASRFLTGVRAKVDKCHDRDLATKVSNPRASGSATSHIEWSTWDLTTEISNKDTVRFRLGFVRFDKVVAQLTFAPAPKDDMSTTQFQRLVERAGDRLRELPRR